MSDSKPSFISKVSDPPFRDAPVINGNATGVVPSVPVPANATSHALL